MIDSSKLLARRIELDESVRMTALQEAFVGKEPVSKIQKAMDKIVAYLESTPMGKMNDTPLDRELEKAIKDVFGFGYVDVFWSDAPSLIGGPYTIPNATIFHISDSKSFAYGKNARGFYDKDHELHCVIHINRDVVVNAHLTSAELTAVLLHEIGHNFDYSPYKMLLAMIGVLQLLYGNIAVLSNWAVSELAPLSSLYPRLRNLDAMIADILPPFRYITRFLYAIGSGLTKFTLAALSPINFVTSIPIALINSPFTYISNIFTRKGERFADSFATMYGYGPEIASGLDKIIGESMGMNDVTYNVPVLKTLYDLSMLNQEIVTLALGGHESNQRRMINMMNMLKKDLEDPNISPSMKKEIRREIDRSQKTYEQMLNLNGEQRDTLTHAFRRVVDGWFSGKPYLFVDSIGDDFVK